MKERRWHSICRGQISFIFVNQNYFFSLSLSLMALVFLRSNTFSFWDSSASNSFFFVWKDWGHAFVLEILQIKCLLSLIKNCSYYYYYYIFWHKLSSSIQDWYNTFCVVQAGLKLKAILLFQPPQWQDTGIWDYILGYYFIITGIIINFCIGLCLSFILCCFDKTLKNISLVRTSLFGLYFQVIVHYSRKNQNSRRLTEPVTWHPSGIEEWSVLNLLSLLLVQDPA